jgi:hypothetical protein
MSTFAAVSFESHGFMIDQIKVKEEGAFTIASWPILLWLGGYMGFEDLGERKLTFQGNSLERFGRTSLSSISSARIDSACVVITICQLLIERVVQRHILPESFQIDDD